MYLPAIILSIFHWILLVAMFWISGYFYFFSKNVPLMLSISIIIYSLSIITSITFSIIKDFCARSRGWKSPKRLSRDRPITSALFYAVCGVIFTILVFITGIMNAINMDIGENIFMNCYVVGIIFSTFGSYYAIQFLPYVGYLVVMLENMIYDTSMILILGATYYFGTALSFYIIGFEAQMEDNSGGNATLSLSETAFNVLLCLQGIAAPDQKMFAILGTFGTLMYIATLLFTVLVMLNLIIGIINRRVSLIGDHENSIVMLQKIAVVTYPINVPGLYFIKTHSFLSNGLKVDEETCSVLLETVQAI